MSAHHIPNELFLQIHITSRCNLACAHCYSEAHSEDMPFHVFLNVLEQFAILKSEIGVDKAWVQLTGGEPLMHPQLGHFLKQSSARFPTRILTNGTAIGVDSAEMLSKYCEAVQVSFDGEEKIHDAWRGKGSFEKALDGMNTLRSSGIFTSARMTLARENQDSVKDLLDRLSPHIDAFNVSRVVPIGHCAVHLPDTDAYRRIIYGLYGRHFTDPRVQLRDPFYGVLLKVDYPQLQFAGCSAGISGVCVVESGDVYPCRRLPIRLGNVREDSLSHLYHQHPLMVDLRSRALSGNCGQCEDRFRCGGSRCIAYALTGNPLAEDPGCIF